MRTVLILNPTAGSSSLAPGEEKPAEAEEIITNALRKHDIELEVWHTTPEDSGNGLAKRAAEGGVDLVIAAGGDGTIHAVASGLIGSNSILGIIAMGTMNNLARSLSIPPDMEAACEVIAAQHTKKIDLGKINGNIFLEVAGIGLEAELFPAAEEIKSQGVLSTVRGAFNGLVKLFTFKPPALRISFDKHRGRPYKALQVTVCNSPYYGVHLQVAPKILMDDGLLDAVIYRDFSKLEYIRHAISITQGRRVLQPKIRQRKVKSLRIISREPVPFHADGIPHGTTPVEIEVIPAALCVCVPEEVTKGPNVANPQLKETERYKKTAKDNRLLTEQEEKGEFDHAR